MRRPLRQYYGGDIELTVDDGLGSVVEPWRRHRYRFLDELAALTDEQWAEPSRCTAWDVKDVISHLITVDAFWVLSLTLAASKGPTTFIRDFDPTTTPDGLVAPMRVQSPAAILEQFDTGTTALLDCVAAFEDWSTPAESPMGHVSARMILAHALWDSWLHERDILEPLGQPTPIETDELLVVTWYSLAFGALQGGLVDDPNPAGPGAEQPIDVVLAFDDLPDHPLYVRIGRGIHIGLADVHPATSAGSAVVFTEWVTGRGTSGSGPILPSDLAAHLDRATRTL